MKSINEWMNVNGLAVNEATATPMERKVIEDKQKGMLKRLSVIAAMKRKGSKEWEYDVSMLLQEIVEDWNNTMEAFAANPDLPVMKYQGMVVDCMVALWDALVVSSVGQKIGPGYRSLTNFSKLAKTLYKAYDKVLLVKPIALKV